MKPCTPGRQLLEAKAKPVQRLKHPKGPLAAPPCLHPTGALEMAHRHEETASPASAWSSQPSQVFRPGPGSLRVPVYPTSQCLEGPKSQPATCLVLAGGESSWPGQSKTESRMSPTKNGTEAQRESVPRRRGSTSQGGFCFRSLARGVSASRGSTAPKSLVSLCKTKMY